MDISPCHPTNSLFNLLELYAQSLHNSLKCSNSPSTILMSPYSFKSSVEVSLPSPSDVCLLYQYLVFLIFDAANLVQVFDPPVYLLGEPIQLLIPAAILQFLVQTFKRLRLSHFNC